MSFVRVSAEPEAGWRPDTVTAGEHRWIYSAGSSKAPSLGSCLAMLEASRASKCFSLAEIAQCHFSWDFNLIPNR